MSCDFLSLYLLLCTSIMCLDIRVLIVYTHCMILLGNAIKMPGLIDITASYRFVVTLTLNFQGQIWNLLYLSQKWSDCHETKSKHVDWTLGLKCEHWFWPWPWPWPWIFKVKCGIRYILVKNGPIARKQKANISIDLKTSNVTIRYDLGCDLDLEFSRWNMNFYISQPKLARLPRNEKQTYWFEL